DPAPPEPPVVERRHDVPYSDPLEAGVGHQTGQSTSREGTSGGYPIVDRPHVRQKREHAALNLALSWQNDRVWLKGKQAVWRRYVQATARLQDPSQLARRPRYVPDVLENLDRRDGV